MRLGFDDGSVVSGKHSLCSLPSHLLAAKVLFEHKAEPNARDKDDYDALMVSARRVISLW